MVDDLARTDPAKLTELYAASQEMQKIMAEDPELFKQTFADYLQRLEKGDLQAAGLSSTAPPAPQQSSPNSSPPAPKNSPGASPRSPPPPPAAISQQASSSPAAAPGTTSSASAGAPDYQEDDEVWYAPSQKQKRPESLLARWSLNSTATRWKDNDDPAPQVYVNVCESEEVTPLEAHSGAIPCYTSELVHHHVDVVLHPDTLAAAKFDSALREDIVNLCLHKVLFFHKLLVQQYQLGGPLFSVILGEVAQHCRPSGPQAVAESLPGKPLAPIMAPPAPPILVTAVAVTETEGAVEVAATLTVESAKDVTVLLLGSNALRLQMAGALPKDIALPCNVLEDDYGCKFVKKSRSLKVTFRKCLEHRLD
eukprot:EG_transcript_16090